ncbi:MAG: hypothetical protein ACLQMO_07495 [Acidobacteriaceae bacterium]
MDYKPPSLRSRIVLYFLISISILIVWGIIGACRYFFSGATPNVKEIVWAVVVYIGMWIVIDFVDQFTWNQKRLNDLEERVSTIEKHSQR